VDCIRVGQDVRSTRAVKENVHGRIGTGTITKDGLEGSLIGFAVHARIILVLEGLCKALPPLCHG
jgi:hypothetical protein